MSSEKIQIVTFNCVLKNKLGKLISSTYNRDVLTGTIESEALLQGLSQALQNIAKGEKRTVELKAADAYGYYDLKKVILFPRKNLPRQINVGQIISIVGKSGTVRTYKALELHENMVSLDGNHPLAGQDLIFEIEALEARAATASEIESATNSISVQLLH